MKRELTEAEILQGLVRLAAQSPEDESVLCGAIMIVASVHFDHMTQETIRRDYE